MRHLRDLVQDPSRHQDHAKFYAASVVMSLAYGKTVHSYEAPEVQGVNRCLTRMGLAMRPGAWKVDIFPFLRFLPGYLKPLREGHVEELSLFRNLLEEVRASPAPPPSFGGYLLERQATLGLSDDETAYLAGSFFGAGSDTTASAISIALMAAAKYPETQLPVRRELLALGRPPTFADKDVLPQTMAFVYESFRWRPVSAGGFPHRATQDIIWVRTTYLPHQRPVLIERFRTSISFLRVRLSSETYGVWEGIPLTFPIPRNLSQHDGSRPRESCEQISGAIRSGSGDAFVLA